MSRYEERLAAHKNEIRSRILAVGGRVEDAVSEAVEGLIAGDRDKCSRIMLGDLAVNRELRVVDKLCHAFVARHLPSAGHLRFVSSALRMDVALERVGDYAVTIARDGVQLTEASPPKLAAAMRALAVLGCRMLHQAMKAFAESDVELARQTKALGKEGDQAFNDVFRSLLKDAEGRSIEDVLRYVSAFKKLQRVCDQAKNICEETLFEVLGETKPAKRYHVLFLDARDTLLGPLAAAIAQRAFPESGVYSSVGFNAGEALAPELLGYAKRVGLDLGDKEPTELKDNLESLGKFHVIVSLVTDGHRHIAKVPFKTAFIQWELPKMADVDGETSAWIRHLQRELGAEVQELMVALRGEDAC
jgi:phosphate transport system protein